LFRCHVVRVQGPVVAVMTTWMLRPVKGGNSAVTLAL
jgi:hypothetical protein